MAEIKTKTKTSAQTTLTIALAKLSIIAKKNTVFAGEEIEQKFLHPLIDGHKIERILNGWFYIKKTSDIDKPHNIQLEFLQKFLATKLGVKKYCMSPELSLLLHADSEVLPKRIDVIIKTGCSTVYKLSPFSSALHFNGNSAAFPKYMDKKYGLNVYSIEEALCKVSSEFVVENQLAVESVIGKIIKIDDIVDVIIKNNGMKSIITRMISLFNRFNRPEDAKNLSAVCELLFKVKISPNIGVPKKTQGKLNEDFLKAREYVQSLCLDRNEWRLWTKGELPEKGLRPKWVSSCPDATYKDAGWISWSDWWHGNKPAKWLTLEEASAYVRALGLKSRIEWMQYCAGKLDGFEAKPSNIPTVAEKVYSSEWVSYDDFLGCGYLSFEEAKEFASSLNLKGQKEWLQYAYGKMQGLVRPLNVPANPYYVYSDQWLGYGDWLGTNRKRAFNGKFPWLEFESARKYARALGLATSKDWYLLAASSSIPSSIPHAPNFVYRDLGWVGWSDWFGSKKNTAGRRNKHYFDFERAWEYAKSLDLKTSKEWFEYVRRPDLDLPKYVPKYPNIAFGESFTGWNDWLGGNF